MIYIVIGLLIIIPTYIEAIIKSRRFSHYSLILICLVMVLIAGLRDKTGTDWNAYYNFYENGTDSVEIGYATLNNLFSNLPIPYNFFLFFINSFSLLFICFFLKKNAFFPVIGILVFFSDLYLYYNLSGIRQAIALSITCFSISYAIKHQFTKFLILILIASCFHLTALVFIVVYFLPRENLKYRHLLFFLLFFGIIGFFLNSISDLITMYTMKNTDYYLNQQEKSDNLLLSFYVGLIKRFIIIFVVLLFGKQIFKYSDFSFFFNIYLVGFLIYLTSYMISPDIGVRISSYFTIFDMVLTGNLIYVLKRRSTRILIVTIFACIALYKLFGYMNEEYYTYHFIF